MSAEESPTGIPTRAIHEAYLDVQQALREYRDSTDHGSSTDRERAHGELQGAVLTFYELLRPHIREHATVKEYWEGEPPSYNGNGTAPDPDNGKGVLHVQRRTDQVDLRQVNQDAFADGGAQSLEEWHDALDLNGSARLVGIARPSEDSPEAFVQFDVYQLGLRELDNWQTEYVEEQTDMGGFLGGKQQTEYTRERVDVDRLKRAARELSDVAQKLGALSQFDASTPRTEITDELIQEIEEWRQRNIE